MGGNWLARIGIVAVIIGIGFFLKLAFDNDWIGETGRVVLGLAVGLALLGAGEFWQRKYPVWSQPVTGGGIAVLYLSIFAAFSLYELIPAWSALAFSLLVTLTAAGLAIRYEARSIAILGILGGFATPLFLAEKLPQQEALLGYVLALDVGVLALGHLPQLALVHPSGPGGVACPVPFLAGGTGPDGGAGPGWNYNNLPHLRRGHHPVPPYLAPAAPGL